MTIEDDNWISGDEEPPYDYFEYIIAIINGERYIVRRISDDDFIASDPRWTCSHKVGDPRFHHTSIDKWKYIPDENFDVDGWCRVLESAPTMQKLLISKTDYSIKFAYYDIISDNFFEMVTDGLCGIKWEGLINKAHIRGWRYTPKPIRANVTGFNAIQELNLGNKLNHGELTYYKRGDDDDDDDDDGDKILCLDKNGSVTDTVNINIFFKLKFDVIG